MSMFAGLAAAGIGSSLIGGLFGSSAASKQAQAEQAATQKALDMKVQQDALAQFRADRAYYGLDAAVQRMKENYGADAAKYLGEKAADPTFNDQQRARVAELDKLIANGGRVDVAGGLPWSNANKTQNTAQSVAERLKSYKAEREALVKAAGGRVGTTGLLNLDGAQDGPGLIQQLNGLSGEREALNNSLMADATDIQTMIEGYGKGQEAQIRRDSERSLTGSNRLARAALMGRGLGAGTSYTGAIERNARSANESMGNQLSALGDRQIQMRSAAAGDKLNLRSNLASQLLQFKSQPINAEMNYATSNIQNPWQGVNTTQYVSSASPSANSGAVWGNLLSGVGGQASNLGMMGYLNGMGSGSASGVNSGLSNLLGSGGNFVSANNGGVGFNF
ncbi:MAG: hypothetical protein KA020_07190 [Planctomycetes bacterium]|nr:hypothetical protein [Planctomycetota bacterium]